MSRSNGGISLDFILADEPATSSVKTKTFNHRLGRSGVTFCAVPALATKLRRSFPQSLHGAPAVLPSENMGMRWALEAWFDKQGVRPKLVGEFEDSTLMEVAASGALGFTTVHTVVDQAALKHYLRGIFLDLENAVLFPAAQRMMADVS